MVSDPANVPSTDHDRGNFQFENARAKEILTNVVLSRCTWDVAYDSGTGRDVCNLLRTICQTPQQIPSPPIHDTVAGNTMDLKKRKWIGLGIGSWLEFPNDSRVMHMSSALNGNMLCICNPFVSSSESLNRVRGQGDA